MDLLAELNITKKEEERLFQSYLKDRANLQNLGRYRAISKFEHSLMSMSLVQIRYFDPLYLPEGSFVFLGGNGRKGDSRALDGLLDLLETVKSRL